MLLRTHEEEEEEERKEEKKVAHLRFSLTKTLHLRPAPTGGASGILFSNNQTDWKESGGTAALVLLGCIEELEEVEEEESFSEMPCRRERC